MSKTTEIKKIVIDTRVYKVIAEAEKVLNDWNSEVPAVAEQMRKLFMSETVTPEMVEIYNLLEARWITLTKYSKNEPLVILYA